MGVCGALSVTVQAGSAPALYEPLPGETPLWSESVVTGLFEADIDLEQARASLVESLGDTCLAHLRVEILEDRVWERAWLEHFRPMCFGRRLWVAPSGQVLPEEAAEDAVVVGLDPGLAFGTGTHETTALCLQWLDGARVTDARVIDYGCGSGILGIAAAALGAREVWAIDIDVQALTATHENARRNGVSDRVRAVPPEELVCRDADILLANILSKPLIALAGELAGRCRQQAHMVLSGILSAQASAVIDAYQPYARLRAGAERAGWVRLQGMLHIGH